MMQRLSYGVKMPVYALAGLLPLLFLPAPFGGDFGRELVFSALAAIAVMVWLVRALASGELRYIHSPILYAAGAMAAVAAASAALSHAPYVSVFFADAPAERLSLIITGILLMIAASSALQSKEEAGTALFILIFAGAAAAAMAAVQMLFDVSIFRYFNIATGADANAIGTINGLAFFFAALAMMTMGLLLSPAAGAWKPWVRVALAAAGFLFLLDIALINFLSAWIAILGASVLFFGLLLIERNAVPILSDSAGDMRSTAGAIGIGIRHWVAIGLVIFSLLMIMMRSSALARLSFAPEVSPSLSATLSIAGSVFKEGPVRVFFGSGPGTFGLLWEKYKDPSINQTIFWGTRFTQGQSWVTTLLATTGLLGVASVLLFLGVALMTFLRVLVSGRGSGVSDVSLPAGSETSSRTMSGAGHGGALGVSIFLGFAVLLIAAFLYPANSSLLLLLFFAVGLLSLVSAARGYEYEAGEESEVSPADGDEISALDVADDVSAGDVSLPAGSETLDLSYTSDPSAPTPVASFWSVRARVIRFTTPWSIFVSSLAIVFFLAAGAAGLYENINRALASAAAFDGIAAANKGDIEGAIAALSRAVEREPRDFHALSALARSRGAKIQQLIASAGAGKNVQQEFQSAVSLALQDAGRLTQMYPDDPDVWRVQGGLYEMIIPFIQGSERFAAIAYQKAVERAPSNPAAFVDWGRAGLIFTERILALENQAQGKDREQLAGARKQNLEQIAAIFQRAIAVKQDYAPAHFLLATVALRLGNADAAIASVENAKQAAPFDIGIAFQLGLLYYQKQDFDRAQGEFERAVSLNDNYSNARYFLGLIYDRKGDGARAIAEFTKIAGLNPDNQEVKRIVDNLTQGKPALDGVVPPASPPEKRKDAPVK